MEAPPLAAVCRGQFTIRKFLDRRSRRAARLPTLPHGLLSSLLSSFASIQDVAPFGNMPPAILFRSSCPTTPRLDVVIVEKSRHKTTVLTLL